MYFVTKIRLLSFVKSRNNVGIKSTIICLILLLWHTSCLLVEEAKCIQIINKPISKSRVALNSELDTFNVISILDWFHVLSCILGNKHTNVGTWIGQAILGEATEITQNNLLRTLASWIWIKLYCLKNNRILISFRIRSIIFIQLYPVYTILFLKKSVQVHKIKLFLQLRSDWITMSAWGGRWYVFRFHSIITLFVTPICWKTYLMRFQRVRSMNDFREFRK